MSKPEKIFSPETLEAAVLAERLYRIWLRDRAQFWSQAQALDAYFFEEDPLEEDVKQILRSFNLLGHDDRPTLILESIMRSQFSQRYSPDGSSHELANAPVFDKGSFLCEFERLLQQHLLSRPKSDSSYEGDPAPG